MTLSDALNLLALLFGISVALIGIGGWKLIHSFLLPNPDHGETP